jgi:hypothetical protein
MTTAASSTALVTIKPAFTDPERLGLAGFLAGYRGLTRDAYALDLRRPLPASIRGPPSVTQYAQVTGLFTYCLQCREPAACAVSRQVRLRGVG